MHLECFGLDCMKRQKRNQLVRDLWRLASSGLGGSRGQSKTAGTAPMPSNNPLDMRIKSTLNSVLKRLDMDELELLLESVKSKGRAHNQCVHLVQRPQPTQPVPPTLGSHTDHNSTKLFDDSCYNSKEIAPDPYTPQQDCAGEGSWAACKAWRWCNLTQNEPLKQIPYCQIPQGKCSQLDIGVPPQGCSRQSQICCINPYHWFKVVDIISDLKPPYCDLTQDDNISVMKKADLWTSSTGLSSSSAPSRQEFWCHVAYWELSTRIGQLLPVSASSIDIFQDIAQGCGVSLDALHKSHIAKSPAIASVRAKIGAGVTLSKEGEVVWLYNHSERDVFVSSSSLNCDKSGGQTWRVCKVTSGHSIIIYDYNIVTTQLHSTKPFTSDGPTDLHSVHISFVKGWSGAYSRQTVLSCECWLEILINETIFVNR